ncbi:MAG: hypothetical protein ACLRXC_04625 [[Clostridium] leptum]
MDAKDLALSFEDKCLFQHVSIEAKRQERIFIIALTAAENISAQNDFGGIHLTKAKFTRRQY